MIAHVAFRRAYVGPHYGSGKERAWMWIFRTDNDDFEGFVSTYKNLETLTVAQAKRLAGEAFRRFPSAQFVIVYPSAWGERLRFEPGDFRKQKRSPASFR